MAQPSILLPVLSLSLGATGLVVVLGGIEWARGTDLMGLGVFILAVLAAAVLGLGGVITGILALRAKLAGPGKGLAIAGLVLSAAPLLLLIVVGVVVQRARSTEPQLPVEPPLERPASSGQ